MPVPGAGLDDDERIGLAQLAPPRVEGAGHHRAEQRTDLGLSEEVAAPARGPAGGVEAVVGVVQGEVDRPR